MTVIGLLKYMLVLPTLGQRLLMCSYRLVSALQARENFKTKAERQSQSKVKNLALAFQFVKRS